MPLLLGLRLLWLLTNRAAIGGGRCVLIVVLVVTRMCIVGVHLIGVGGVVVVMVVDAAVVVVIVPMAVLLS